MKNLVKFLLVFFLLQTSSCRWFSSTSSPYFFGANFKIPPGTPVFQQGFKDGCSSILFARGNGFYRWRNNYRYDVKLSRNTEYRFGHSRGMSWCFQNIIGTTTLVSFDRYILPYGNDENMLAADIGTAWGGMFEGTGKIIENGNGFDDMFKVWSGGKNGGAMSANPIWAGGSEGQFFGQ